MKKNQGSANYTRDNFFKEVNKVMETGAPYTITKNGLPAVTMIPSETFERLSKLIKTAKEISEYSKDLDLSDDDIIEDLQGSVKIHGEPPEDIEETIREAKKERTERFIKELNK